MIALVILIIAGAFASGYILRGLVDRTGSLPPATRRAIRRDRAQRIADLSDVPAVWRSPIHTATQLTRRQSEPPGAALDGGQPRMLAENEPPSPRAKERARG